MTDYIKSIEFVGGDMDRGLCTYWIDDPTLPISGDVKDFKPSAFNVRNVSLNAYTTFVRIMFNSHVARYPKIRIGVLSGSGDRFKPRWLSVGGVEQEWVNRGEDDYGVLNWMFFDVNNTKHGSENSVELAIKGENQWNTCRIEGIIFDSIYKKTGFEIRIR